MHCGNMGWVDRYKEGQGKGGEKGKEEPKETNIGWYYNNILLYVLIKDR